MSFLKIKAVRLDCKECLPDNIPEPKQGDENGSLADSLDFSSSVDGNIKWKNDKNTGQQKRHDLLSGEKLWRVPRQAQLHVRNHHKTTPAMSPVATNSQTNLHAFPKLTPIKQDGEKAGNVENGISVENKRSKSTPGSSCAQAKVRKHKFRLPNIPDLGSLSITDKRPMKSLVVEGKKLESVSDGSSSPDSCNNNIGFSNNESKVNEEKPNSVQRKKLNAEKAKGKTDSRKDGFHGDACEDYFPSIKKNEFRVKTAYVSSSRVFNTYLQSRFGKSVYESLDINKTGTGVGKKHQIYWAPVLIKKKVLYNRTETADSPQESRELGARATKERKVHFGSIEASV